MLRTTRLPPGRRALLPHPTAPTSTATTTTPARPITFATGKSYRPILLTGTRGGMPKPNPSKSSLFFTRPPSTWSESTQVLATIAAGAMLGGSWYIWEEGRSYKVAGEVDKYEPKVLGMHKREEKVNPDFVSYEQWVEKHGRKGK